MIKGLDSPEARDPDPRSRPDRTCETVSPLPEVRFEKETAFKEDRFQEQPAFVLQRAGRDRTAQLEQLQVEV